MQDPGKAVKTAALIAALVLAVLLQPPPARADGEVTYTPGRGLHVAPLNLTLGGYGSVGFTRDEGGPAELGVDDLALFVTWDPVSRVHLFSELEGEDLVTVDDHGHGGVPGASFTTERLYGDFAVNDWLNLRVGKFLTPVGRWNQIHAQPLVWTTSRPLVTEVPFDPHTTGGMVFGSTYPGGGTASYQLFGQFTGQLSPVSTPTRIDRSGGARVEWAADAGWSVGATYLAFTSQGSWRYLTGLDGLWRRGPLEMMGEFAHVTATHGPDRWGLYLQAVVEVAPRLFVVGRYEHEDDPGSEVNLMVGGLAWKPWDPLVLKVEYLGADHPSTESPPGVKSSVAWLF